MKRSFDDSAPVQYNAQATDMGAQATKQRRTTDDSSRNLMVNYLPKTVTEDRLRQLFSTYGEIERVNLVTEPNGTSKCYGFVKYTASSAAEAAIRGLHGFEIEGKHLRVAYSTGQKPKKDVFFSGFGSGFSNDDLKLLASQYGTVEDATVLDPAKHKQGVGFVRFSTPEEAALCIENLNNYSWGEGSQLVVKYPRSKDDDRQKQQHQQRNMGGMMGGVYPGGMGADQQVPLLAMLNMMQNQGMGGMGAMGGMGGMGMGGMGMGGMGGMNPAMGMMQGQGGMGMGGMGGMGGGAPRAPRQPQVGGTEHVLFVRGFTEASEAEARTIFDKFGAVKYDIPKAATGRSRNYCFVHFPSQQHSQAAITQTNGQLLGNGRTLQVKHKGEN